MVEESNVMQFKRQREPEAAGSGTVMETKLLTADDLKALVQPNFQRPIRLTTKVLDFCEDLKRQGGIISGVITLGQLPNDPATYKVDGSHRIEAALMSGLAEFIADVRLRQYPSMSAMADDFVKLNSSLVRLRPDDLLRGLEENVPTMRKLRQTCGDFLGYDNIRRASTASVMLGMSTTLRCWIGSSKETPQLSGLGVTATTLCEALTDRDVDNLSAFLNIAFAAWGRDPEYYRLWSGLNLTMCMWLWRRLVLDPQRGRALNGQEFGKCLMSVSACSEYIDWLQGRHMNERDRSPCYKRLRAVFSKRIVDERIWPKAPKFPSPPWVTT